MKGLIAFIIGFMLLIAPAQALMDNFYFTIPPEDSRCITTRLPIDLNTLSKGYYTLETASDFPVNLEYIKTFAEAVNIVRVPICFYSQGKQEGDFSYYTIKASAMSLYREFQGGICVSGRQDVESREPGEGQSPCELINGYEDLFYISFLEPVQWALPGTSINYTLLVQSMNSLDLDITFSSGLQLNPQRVSVRIPETGRAEPVSLEVKAPNSGEHEIKARARAKIGDRYCDIPFCLMEANTTLSVGSLVRSGFGVFTFPQFLSVDFAEAIPYTIFIENRDDEAGFNVQIRLPEGLQADWTRKTVSVKKDERKELGVNITPLSQEPGQYTIEFSVSSGGIEQSQEAYLSVKEIESDILRRWDVIKRNLSEVKRQELDFEIDKLLADYRAGGFDPDNYRKMDTLLEDAEGFKPPVNGKKQEPQPLNPLLIAIPLIAVILVLVYMFYKKSRPFEEREEGW